MTNLMHLMDMGVMHGVEVASRLAATSFVAGLWQGVVLAAGVGICLRFVPRTTAAVRFMVWTAVFAVLVVLPLVHAYGLRAGREVSGHAAMVRLDVRWSFAIAAIWGVVSLIRAVELAIGAVRLRGVWKKATPVEVGSSAGETLIYAGSLVHFAGELVVLAGKRKVQVCTSVDVDRPSVIGFFSPRILIPEELYARVTAEELEQIVLHEDGHLRRRDDWMNLLQKISLVLVPLNPALMWIERRLCFERELACDDSVLQLTKAPKAYATCLTNLAEHRMNRRMAALSLGAWERRSELGRRVHSILRGSQSMGLAQARVVMSVLVLGLLGGAAELARCPQLVSFSRSEVPVSLAAQSLPSSSSSSAALPASSTVAYQPVVFHPQKQAEGSPHETLLKASMPVERGVQVQPVKRAVAKRRRVTAPAPALVRSGQGRTVASASQQWIVLTSWTTTERAGMVLAVTQERGISSSYAAVPTPGGWLVIQL